MIGTWEGGWENNTAKGNFLDYVHPGTVPI